MRIKNKRLEKLYNTNSKSLITVNFLKFYLYFYIRSIYFLYTIHNPQFILAFTDHFTLKIIYKKRKITFLFSDNVFYTTKMI